METPPPSHSSKYDDEFGIGLELSQIAIQNQNNSVNEYDDEFGNGLELSQIPIPNQKNIY